MDKAFKEMILEELGEIIEIYEDTCWPCQADEHANAADKIFCIVANLKNKVEEQ